MDAVNELIGALRCCCTAGSVCRKKDCPYFVKEKVDTREFGGTGIEDWDGCDFDRIGLEAAACLEILAGGVRSECGKLQEMLKTTEDAKK